MDNNAAPQTDSPKPITLLYAAVSVKQEFRALGPASAVQAMRESLEMIAGIAAERESDFIKDTDGSIVASFADPAEAVKAAIQMQRSVKGSRDGGASLAVRIILHCGQGSFRDGEVHGDIAVFAAEAGKIAKAGHIYVSSAVYQSARELKAVEFNPTNIENTAAAGGFPFYDLVWYPETDCTPGRVKQARADGESASNFFVHGPALLAGENNPCFYCGSRRHRTTYCPSKHLPYGTDGLEKLGHFPVGEINEIFANYLEEAGEDLPAPLEADTENLTYLAPWSFYELKKPFQLRFLNLMWSALPKEDWYKVKEGRRETSAKGEVLWLARDCIRTSDLDEAENLFTSYSRQNWWKDHRTSCGLAFIRIEQGQYAAAADFLREALEQESSPAQKTYIYLLLSRLFNLVRERDKSLDALKEAMRIEPYCLEARFEEAILHFQMQHQADALARLVKLLHLSHEYYVPAFISPELTEFQPLIIPELDKFGLEVHKTAQRLSKEADEAVEVLKGVAGDGDGDVSEILFMQEHMHELLRKPKAFLNSHDAFHVAKKISAACVRVERDRREEVMETLRVLHGRAIELLRSRVGRGRIEPLVRPVLGGLNLVGDKLNKREPFAGCVELCAKLSATLDSVQEIAERLKRRAELFRTYGSFFKDSIFVLFVTAVTGLVLFPGAFYCLAAVHNGLVLSPIEVWRAQKIVLVVGGVFAAVFAIGHALLGKLKIGVGVKPK